MENHWERQKHLFLVDLKRRSYSSRVYFL